MNGAYKLLRELGMRPAIARHFIVRLRKSGFVLVEEKKLIKTDQINKKIEIIIKLMKSKRSRIL